MKNLKGTVHNVLTSMLSYLDVLSSDLAYRLGCVVVIVIRFGDIYYYGQDLVK